LTHRPPSSDDADGVGAAPLGLAALRFDPESLLLRESSVLFDPNFLGALHGELADELGARDADLTLLQMGFLHGLHDAYGTINDAFAGERMTSETGQNRATPVAMVFRSDGGARTGEAALSLRGHWPQHTEAAARLESRGRPEAPGCLLSAGYTSGWLSGTLDADILAVESDCCACGTEHCAFEAREAAEWRDRHDPAVDVLLGALPFDVLRSFVRRSRDARDDAMREMNSESSAREMPDAFDPNGSVVHIWGSVMVIPFNDSDEALRAVELIGHDPAAREVSVVVVDLSNAIVDEAYGALALEQIVDLIEAWGAEAIFASVSPLSEPAVADLERQPLFIHKDLAEAIASAFRVADAQRSAS
jgi:hypothetical protein